MAANRFVKTLILASVACLIIYYFPNFNEVNQFFHAPSVFFWSDSDTSSFKPDSSFHGEENWSDEELELCNNPDADKTWTRPDALCYVVTRRFEFSNIEIVSWSDPVLVIYRSMFTPKQVDGYSQVYKNSQIEPEKVFDEYGDVYISPTRIVNGSRAKASEYPEVRSIFDTASKHIPSLNFECSEPLLGLSYLPGGHCSTHHDYLEFIDEAPEEAHMETGNRLVTFIILIENADAGGATVFPYLNATVRANPGDAFMWTNILQNEEIDIMSYHGGCPVFAGKKLIATIFLRTKGQHYFKIVEGKKQSFHTRELLR